MILAQITDTHVRGPIGTGDHPHFDEAARLANAVALINAWPDTPDLVIATGDLTQNGSAAEFEALADILSGLRVPYAVMPGNHDTREGMRTQFAAQFEGCGKFLHYTIEDLPVRLVCLDTMMADSHGGELCAERLAWLDETLAARPDAPTIVAMHHPPFETRIPNARSLRFKGGVALAAILRQHPQVERVIAGHIHRAMLTRFGGTVASVAPSTAYTYALNLREPEKFIATDEPPGLQFHVYEPVHGLLTHTVAIGDYFTRVSGLPSAPAAG
ncbi:MAG: phosphodiesterase [Alphaproteobacteria bacterium]|nr:phosphodiesterase [Alphaproteobacteria bacterium]